MELCCNNVVRKWEASQIPHWIKQAMNIKSLESSPSINKSFSAYVLCMYSAFHYIWHATTNNRTKGMLKINEMNTGCPIPSIRNHVCWWNEIVPFALAHKHRANVLADFMGPSSSSSEDAAHGPTHVHIHTDTPPKASAASRQSLHKCVYLRKPRKVWRTLWLLHFFHTIHNNTVGLFISIGATEVIMAQARHGVSGCMNYAWTSETE